MLSNSEWGALKRIASFLFTRVSFRNNNWFLHLRIFLFLPSWILYLKVMIQVLLQLATPATDINSSVCWLSTPQGTEDENTTSFSLLQLFTLLTRLKWHRLHGWTSIGGSGGGGIDNADCIGDVKLVFLCIGPSCTTWGTKGRRVR